MNNFCQALTNLSPGSEWRVSHPENTITWIKVVGDEPSQEQIQAEIARLEAEQPWKELRQQRNRLIAETDYLALSDSTLSAEMAIYRQALRDLPANTTDPANPVWPTKPGG